NRAQQGAVGVWRPLLAAPPQPRRQVDLADPLDQRRHLRVGGAQRVPRLPAHRPVHCGRRFSAKALIPSRKSCEAKQDSRSAISPASCCSLRSGEEASRSIALLLPRIESGALAAISAASSAEEPSRRSSSTVSLTRPIRSARPPSRLRPVRNSSLVR